MHSLPSRSRSLSHTHALFPDSVIPDDSLIKDYLTQHKRFNFSFSLLCFYLHHCEFTFHISLASLVSRFSIIFLLLCFPPSKLVKIISIFNSVYTKMSEAVGFKNINCNRISVLNRILVINELYRFHSFLCSYSTNAF